jgi:hypothetical protein
VPPRWKTITVPTSCPGRPKAGGIGSPEPSVPEPAVPESEDDAPSEGAPASVPSVDQGVGPCPRSSRSGAAMARWLAAVSRWSIWVSSEERSASVETTPITSATAATRMTTTVTSRRRSVERPARSTLTRRA